MSLNDILNTPLKNFLPTGVIAAVGGLGLNSDQAMAYIAANPRGTLIAMVFLLLAAHITPSPADTVARKQLAQQRVGDKPTGGA